MYPWLNDTYERLSARAAAHSLHHGLLIKGIPGIGKAQLANELAGFLLCHQPNGTVPCGQCQGCKLFAASSHPDFHQIESEKQIGVDQIREAIAKLLGTAQLSGNKVLIIHGADSMTESAANALLKTLEEPTRKTYLILLCDRTDGVLPTILSRCEKISIHAPDTNTCITWLQAQGIEGITEKQVRLYANAPLILLQALKDPSGVTFETFVTALVSLQKRQSVASEVAQSWTEDADQVLAWFRFITEAQLKTEPHNQKLWTVQSKVVTAMREVGYTGIKKDVLLTGVLQQVNTLNTISAEEYTLVS